MAFLGHLCLIFTGFVGLCIFLAYPKEFTFIALTLTMGYIGSTEGFMGTVIGLGIGAVAGAIVAMVMEGIAAIGKWIYQRFEKPKPANGVVSTSPQRDDY